METRHKLMIGIILAFFAYLFIFLSVSLAGLVRSGRTFPLYSLTTEGQQLWIYNSESRKLLREPLTSREVLIDGSPAQAGIKNGSLYVRYGDKRDSRVTNSTKLWEWSPIKPEFYYIDAEPTDKYSTKIWKWTRERGFEAISKMYPRLYYVTVSLDGKHLTALQNLAVSKSDNNRLLVFGIDGHLEGSYELTKTVNRILMISDHEFLLTPRNTTDYQRKYSASSKVYRFDSITKKRTQLKLEGHTARDVATLNGQIWVLLQDHEFVFSPISVGRNNDKVFIGRLDPGLQRLKHVTQIPTEKLPK